MNIVRAYHKNLISNIRALGLQHCLQVQPVNQLYSSSVRNQHEATNPFINEKYTSVAPCTTLDHCTTRWCRPIPVDLLDKPSCDTGNLAMWWGDWKRATGKRGTMKNTGVENAGLENVGPNRRGGKGRTGKRRTKFRGWKTHDHRLWNAKWISIKLKGTLYDMYILLQI